MTIVLGRDNPYDDASLASVRPDDANVYLASRGWRQVRELRRMGLWVAPGEEGYEVLAPLDAGSGDFPRLVYELVRDLSAVEDRPARSVLQDLLAARVDTIRVRVQPRSAQDGASIQLNDGVTLVTQARNLLVAAARSTIEPHPTHTLPPGRRPGLVHDYLESARLGQTEQGSYVVAITSPVNAMKENKQLSMLSDNEPFSRQVTRTLARSAKAARDTAEEAASDDTRLERFFDAVEEGVSANLCDSLARIGRPHGGFTISFAWAPSHPAPGLVTAVDFTDRELRILARADKLLRKGIDRGEFTLEGRIPERLTRDWEQGPGWVQVDQLRGSPRYVWVHLDARTYRRAVEAHDRSETVRARGRLIQKGRRWELDAYQQAFTVVGG